MQNIGIDFTSKKISPWGGIHLFHSVYDRYGIRRYLKQLDLPMPGSNRGIDPVEIVESFLVSVVLGSRRLAHSGMIRTDEVIRQIFGWIRPGPSQSKFSIFFQKFNKKKVQFAYPNPAKNELIVSLKDAGFSQANLRIKNLEGQNMIQIGDVNSENIVVPIQHFNPGMYLLMCWKTSISMWCKNGLSVKNFRNRSAILKLLL